MIKTNGDFISAVRNGLRLLNKDDYTSARYILSIATPYVEFIVNNRLLWKFFRDRGVFTLVKCVEMKRIKKVECEIAEFRLCDKIMSSKKKLPDIMNTKMGFAIEYIMNIINDKEYEPLRSPADYKNNKLRQFGHLFQYYYVSDEYLYILNTTAERINMSAAFLDEEEAKCLSDCDDDCDECGSKLDDKFVCPSEFRSTVIEQTVQFIAGGKQLPEDSNPDMDSNQKTRTQQ